MTKRALLWVITVALLVMSAAPGWAKPAPAPSPNVPAKAGQITALLPVAKIVRGTGKAATTNDAKKGDELVWNDLVKTEKGGRARITLADQSILSLGSQAELRIVKHDARAQQTALQMAYGRVRAQVASITRNGGSFELRTPTAVAGVIGTDFGVDSSATGGDTFICLAGATQISNSDPSIPGSVQCSAGQTTTVMPGKSPTAPTAASLQQLQQLIEDTEPAIISSMVPAAAMPGTDFDASIAGTKLGKVTSISVAGGSGVTATIKESSETSLHIHVVIDAAASAGPRTITLEKAQGASSATVFTVLGTPIGDPKKVYLETLDQLRTTGIGGLGAFLTGAQQAADQVAQQITQANQNLPRPLDLSPFATSLNQQYSIVSTDIKGGTGSIDKAAQEAANTFAGLYDAAYQELLQRDSTGTPDATFRTALTGAFTQANAILQAALQTTQTSLNGSIQMYGNQLNTIEQTWSQNINNAFLNQQGGPLPKVNALERIVELGANTSFDASSTAGSNASSSINSFRWTLCSGNYQPQGFGQLLPANTAPCNGIQGFASTNPEFQIATCSLQPGSYYARLAVTDTDNKISQMDVRLTVLAPNYPTAGGTVRALADAYTSLQLSQFLRWFDAAQFSGYTPLSENIRQTMQSLSSMAINLRLSQENVTCNDATVRADWQQNYSFIGDTGLYSQNEQLSVRLQRTPGRGWYITDFQGDNGKVQGVPGPQTTDVASPDLVVAGVTIDGRPLNPGAPLAVAAGPHSVVVDIANNGTAPLSLGVLLPVVITVQDANGSTSTTIDTFNGSVPTPLNTGSSMSIQTTLNFPASATNLGMLVQVNPNCNPPERTCGAPNNASYPLALGLPDFNANFIPTASVGGIVGRAFSLAAVNVTPSPYPAPLTVTYSGLPAGLAAGSLPGNSTNISGALIAGTPSATGSSNVTATASAAGTTKNVTGSATISIGPEIVVTSQTAPTFDSGGAAQNLVLNVSGGVYPVTVSLALPTGFTTTSGTVSNGFATQVLSGPGPLTYSLTASNNSVAGNQNFTVIATDPGVAVSNTPAGNKTFTFPYTVNGNASYAIIGFNVFGHTTPYTQANAFQVGESAEFKISVKNNGNISPAGNITLTLDCGDVSVCEGPLTTTVPAPAAGATTLIDVPVDFIGFTVKSYSGSIALSTDVQGASITGSPVPVPFDVVDFTIGGASLSPFQNLPINGTAQLGVSVAVQSPSTPFGIPITAAPTDPALVFNPVTQVLAGAQILFPVTIGPGAIPGQGTVRFNATNHGVTKSVDIPYVAYTANFTSTTLFVNDFANPLQVPVAVGATPPPSFPRVELKLNGNFDTTSGPAAITVQQPGCGTFAVNLFPTTVVPNDTVDMPIYAASGNTCPAGTQVILDAAIPQTFPPVTMPVYVLFVTPAGLSDLRAQSATPARDLSSQPWLSGEPMDWDVVVKNSGSGPSAGNEKITIYANGAEVGQGTLPSAIPAGQTANVTVHTVAPDYPEDSRISSFISVRVNVQADSQGDLNPSSGDFFTSANFSNWGIAVISSQGQSDEIPVDLSPTTTSAQVEIAIKNQASFNPNLNLSLVPGSYSMGQLSAPGFSPSTLSASTSSFVNVSFPGASSPVNGTYFVQVLAQMKDGGTVTAQRQATIHVRMNSQPKTPAPITLASDRSNIGPLGNCNGCQTVQINGPLPEEFTLTASVSSCSAGNGCPGTADISFTDTFSTVTTPQVSTVQVTSPGNKLPVRVKAGDNPDGSINTGSAQVIVSVSAVQSSFFGAARTPTPDPVGTQFEMNFNIADLNVTSSSSSCIGVTPQDPTPVQLTLNWSRDGNFDVMNLMWEWQDANHVPVSGSQLSFDLPNGNSMYNGNGYDPVAFKITNPTNGIDGLQTYYFAFTVSNGFATATKYFPFDFDLSRGQTFCPILGGQRGAAGGTVIRGSWGKAGLNAPHIAALSSARTAAAPVNGKLPDLRINAGDISFTPSMPKQGDTVAVRFRISNMGDADATGVPVALQVRGTTVVSDTFDIPAGRTVLGGLEWTNAHASGGATTDADAKSDAVAARRAIRAARLNIDTPETDVPVRGTGGRLGLMQAQIVIDPQKTITQKSTLAKSAPLAHFGLRNSNAELVAESGLNEQRVLLELPEGGCGGIKFAAGAGSCTSADITFTVEDLAKASYKLESLNGVADLGMGNTSTANASYGSQAVGQNGHTYAVQLNGSKVGIVTVTAVRNPEQLSEAAKRLFRQRHAVRVMKSLGGTTDAPDTGDTAAGGSQPMVYFDIVYQGQ